MLKRNSFSFKDPVQGHRTDAEFAGEPVSAKHYLNEWRPTSTAIQVPDLPTTATNTTKIMITT